MFLFWSPVCPATIGSDSKSRFSYGTAWRLAEFTLARCSSEQAGVPSFLFFKTGRKKIFLNFLPRHFFQPQFFLFAFFLAYSFPTTQPLWIFLFLLSNFIFIMHFCRFLYFSFEPHFLCIFLIFFVFFIFLKRNLSCKDGTRAEPKRLLAHLYS